MKSVFKGRSFLAEKDFTRDELQYMIDFSLHVKELKQKNIPHRKKKKKNVALLFEKNSTRTRAAFTVAAVDLGAHPEFLGANDIQMGSKESVEDSAKVFGRMFDGIEYRGFSQRIVEDLAKYSGVPVWNGLSDMWHPTQMIADFMTIQENFGSLEGLTIAYCGDGRNNVAQSLLVTSRILGVAIRIIAPKELQPEQQVIELAEQFAQASQAEILITDDVAAVAGADVVYTDVWVSMGEPDEVWKERIEALSPYQINKAAMDNAKDNAVFMHCLPAFHDLKTKIGKEIHEKYGLTEMEVTDEVFEKYADVVFREAENRMHTIKAVMYVTLPR